MAELTARYREFEKALESKNVDNYSKFFCADIEAWGPKGEPTTGKEAVTKDYEYIVSAGDLAVTDMNAQECGEFGFVTYKSKFEGEILKDMVVWRKVGGEWLIFRIFYSPC